MHVPDRLTYEAKRLLTAVADLCRGDPAGWSTAVHRSDQLERGAHRCGAYRGRVPKAQEPWTPAAPT